MFKINFSANVETGYYEIKIDDDGMNEADKHAACVRALQLLAAHILHGKPNVWDVH